jgi:hypothetical protein
MFASISTSFSVSICCTSLLSSDAVKYRETRSYYWVYVIPAMMMELLSSSLKLNFDAFIALLPCSPTISLSNLVEVKQKAQKMEDCCYFRMTLLCDKSVCNVRSGKKSNYCKFKGTTAGWLPLKTGNLMGQ